MYRNIIILIFAVCVCALALVGINRWRSSDVPERPDDILRLPSITEPIIAQEPDKPQAPDQAQPAAEPQPPIAPQIPAAPEYPVAEPQTPDSTPAEPSETPASAPVAMPSAPAPASGPPASSPPPQPENRASAPAPAAPKPPAPKPAAQETFQTKGTAQARVTFSGSTAIVAITGSGAFDYASMLLPSPDRLAVDLNGEWQVSVPNVPRNLVLSRVRVGAGAARTRIVLDLHHKPAYEIKRISPSAIEIHVR